MDCGPQDSLSMGFPRQEYWSGLPFPPLGDILDPGIQPVSLALAGGCFSTEPPGRPMLMLVPFYLYRFTLSPLSWFQKLPWIPSLGEVPVLTPQHPVYNSNSARHQNGLWMCLSMPLAKFKLLEETGMNFHSCRHTMVSTMCNARLHICWSLILITMEISSLSMLMGHNTHCQQSVRWWELTVCGKEYVIDGRLFRTFCEWKFVGHQPEHCGPMSMLNKPLLKLNEINHLFSHSFKNLLFKCCNAPVLVLGKSRDKSRYRCVSKAYYEMSVIIIFCVVCCTDT